jgi:hypothetical protein
VESQTVIDTDILLFSELLNSLHILCCHPSGEIVVLLQV